MVKKILVVDCGSSKVPHICALVATCDFETQLVKMQELAPEKITDFKGLIISGAPILITQSNKEELLKPFLFIKDLDIPILGICFGHQILGMLYGAEIFLGKEVRTEIAIEIIKDSPIFKGIDSKNLIVSQDHTEGISLPENFVLLAKSEHYPNEAMEHKSKNMFGVQFHPETSSDLGKLIVTNFLSICSGNNL